MTKEVAAKVSAPSAAMSINAANNANPFLLFIDEE
jgi:O6-methylguanine-DNA--protein-cysteine methyltransferase